MTVMDAENAAVAQLVERVLGKDEVHGFDPRQQLSDYNAL